MTTSPVADLARTGVCLCIIQPTANTGITDAGHLADNDYDETHTISTLHDVKNRPPNGR
jgi:hypothetical protein